MRSVDRSEDQISALSTPLIASVDSYFDVFDVFAGKRAAEQFGEGLKSIAISVRLQPTDATLTDAEIDAVAERVVASVGKATGARLRG